MTTITEAEFARIVSGVRDDRATIIKNNPLGTSEEILLWMLLSVLHSYLNLTELETPCFSGKPDAETYLDAIQFVLRDRKAADFDASKYLELLRDDN